MRYLTLLRAGMRKQRGNLIGIFTLMLIISVTLCSVLTIKSNSASYIEKEVKRVNIGNILYMVANVPDIDQILSEIRAVDGTKETYAQRMILTKAIISGKESSGNIQGMVYAQEDNVYSIFNSGLDGYEENPELLKDGEIYAPISFCSIYKAKVGDDFTFKYGDITETYKIKGFFEDPLMGSSMMGIKRVFMTENDQQKYRDRLMEAGCITGDYYLVHVIHNETDNHTLKEYQNEVNTKTTVDNYSVLSYQRETLQNFMLLLQNIFFGFLAAFVLVLLVTAVIVIGHSISSCIELDYVDMGILKAVGCRNRNLIRVQVAQYVIVVFFGLLLGQFLSPGVVKLVNRMIVTVTGIEISNKLPLSMCLASFGTILLLLTLYVILKTSAIGKITPICAIRGGKKDVFFSDRLHTSIHKRGLSIWLGIRQLCSGKKHYVSAGLITILIVFFLSLCGRIQAWIEPDGSGLMNTMGMAGVNGRTYDFGVRFKEEEIQDEVEKIIEKYTKTLASYESLSTSGQLDQTDYAINVISNPEYLHMLKGKTCTYDNEVVITETISRQTGLQIGDWVTISINGNSEQFMITGYNQCANDMGANFSISKDAYQKLTGFEGKLFVNYVLEDKEQKDSILKELKAKYEEDILIDDNTWSGAAGIVRAVDALTIMMYVICAIFIITVISMTGSKILYKEQHDLGIYKSLGFKSNMLRMAFSVRFGLIALIGSVLGVVVSIFATDPFVGVVLQSFGISTFSTRLSFLDMIKPAVCVILFFCLFSFWCSGKIKKTDVGILIVE